MGEDHLGLEDALPGPRLASLKKSKKLTPSTLIGGNSENRPHKGTPIDRVCSAVKSCYKKHAVCLSDPECKECLQDDRGAPDAKLHNCCPEPSSRIYGESTAEPEKAHLDRLSEEMPGVGGNVVLRVQH